MKTTLYCLLVFACCALACKRNKTPSPYIQLGYETTGCSNPWSAEIDGNVALEVSLRKWLDEEKDIQAHELKIVRVSAGDGCYACHCKTGHEIRIGVSADDVKKAEDLGFTKR
ncbi:hypothetical protein [Chitinophaga sp. YIM B06452]|uniref:hypothetical protein n=1 Tax=Chitinophaga sp. YIM B06452 TaxID=3082158 RepID=UPI0031FEBE80